MIDKISIIGGDLRIVKLAEMLIKENVEVYTYALENTDIQDEYKCKTLEEAINKTEIIFGPIPFSSNENAINTPFGSEKIFVSDFINIISGKTLIAGGINQEIYDACLKKNIKVIDILNIEELAVLNAISTAEGAIKIAIEETAKTIHRSNVLIMGFGRIGKILANMLKALGANVACEARKNSDLAWIKAYGYEPIHLKNLKEELSKFDIIINTIPFVILDKEMLDYLKDDALVIDLASNPGGVDKEAVKEKKIKYILAFSLPGKVAPITSAEYIKDTLYNISEDLKT